MPQPLCSAAPRRLLHLLLPAALCREVEAELEAVTKERDTLLPSVEEIKWQLRKSEKRVDEVASSRAELEQVGRCSRPACLRRACRLLRSA